MSSQVVTKGIILCSLGTSQLVTDADNFLGQLVICDELTVWRVDRYQNQGPDL